jgi:phage shock protein A
MMRWLLVLSVLIATGCSTTGGRGTTSQCDPSRGGFFSGISCSSSGGYDQRVRELNQEMLQTKADNETLTQRYQSAKAQAVNLDAEKRQLESQYKTLDNDLNNLEQKIHKSKAKKDSLLASLSSIRNQEKLLRAQADGNPSDVSKKLADLQAKKKELEAEIDLVRTH